MIAMDILILILACTPALIGVFYAEGNKRHSGDPADPSGPLDQKRAWSRAAAISLAQAICAALAIAFLVGF